MCVSGLTLPRDHTVRPIAFEFQRVDAPTQRGEAVSATRHTPSLEHVDGDVGVG
jgi:hypothetical protein